MFAAIGRGARFDPAQRTANEILLDLDRSPFVATPGQRKRKMTASAERAGACESRAVAEPVAVFKAQDRQKQQMESTTPDDARRLAFAAPVDVHRSFVDDDDDHDPRR